VREGGGEVRTGPRADRILTDGWRVTAVVAADGATGRRKTFPRD
jgi:hypothetical protein